MSLSLSYEFASDSACSQDELVLRRILLKLYHIEQGLQEHAQAIRDQNQTLAGLREEQRRHETELEEARAEQALARSSVMQKEKKMRKAEKALEGKVLCLTHTSDISAEDCCSTRNPTLCKSRHRFCILSEGVTMRTRRGRRRSKQQRSSENSCEC